MLSLAFTLLLTTQTGCRSTSKTITTTTIDTTYRLNKISRKDIKPLPPIAYEDSDLKIRFETPEAIVDLTTSDDVSREQLMKLKSKIITSIEIKERDVELRATKVEKDIKKENDSPIKNFFFSIGVLAVIIIVVYVVLKAVR